MGLGQPGVQRRDGQLHKEGQAEGEEERLLYANREPLRRHGDVGDAEGGRAPLHPEVEDGRHHRHGADERDHKQLGRRCHPLAVTPGADQQRQRQQHELPEEGEEQQVDRAERAEHGSEQREKAGVIGARGGLDGVHAGHRGDHAQHRGEAHEPERQAIDAQVIPRAERRNPGHILGCGGELKAGLRRVEAGRHGQEEEQREQRKEAAHHPMGLLVLARHEGQQQRAGQRRKDDEGQPGHGGTHGVTPPRAMRKSTKASPMKAMVR